MSKKTPSQDFNYNFEVIFDKEKETKIQKIKRWIKKQNPPFNTILMHLFSYVELWYWEGKVIQTMSDVDSQVEELHDLWDKEHATRTTTVEERPSSVPDLPTLIIRNDIVERGTEESSASVDATSIENPFPDPWEGDWNDGVYIWEQINKEKSL